MRPLIHLKIKTFTMFSITSLESSPSLFPVEPTVHQEPGVQGVWMRPADYSGGMCSIHARTSALCLLLLITGWDVQQPHPPLDLHTSQDHTRLNRNRSYNPDLQSFFLCFPLYIWGGSPGSALHPNSKSPYWPCTASVHLPPRWKLIPSRFTFH